MEPANKPSVTKTGQNGKALDFLPDADEIERTPIARGAPITLYTLLALLAVSLLWANLSEIDEVVSTRGRLVTPLPNILIQPLETAHIQSVQVSMGQIVKKGQILATLDPTFAEADLSQARDRLKSLDAELNRLEAEAGGRGFEGGKGRDDVLQGSLDFERRAAYRARLTRLDENIGRLKASIATNTHDIASLETRVTSLRELEAMNETLVAKQFQSRRVLLESQERRLEVERQLINARNRTNELKRELAGAEAEKSAFIKESRQKTLEELVATRRERDTIAEQVLKADRRSQLITLVAPVDAVVLEIAKHSPGSIIRQAEQLFSLVPLDAPLEVEVKIEAPNISYVKVGDPVKIKIDAFPFQKHGVILGKLTKLSQDAFAPETGKPESGSYYLARVEFGKVELKNLNRPVKLLPGMSLTGEIVVGKRTIISYLMYPMIRAMDEAAREPNG